MTQTPLPPPTADEINLRQLAAALQRHWRLIAKVAGGTLLISTIYAFVQPRVWEGEFQIVLASESGSRGRITQLAAANPLLADIAGLSGGQQDNLATQVKVLESPSVLKPIFDFVRSSKQRTGQNVDRLRFISWRDSNVKVELESGTNVLNISYSDTDKDLVLPVMERISKAYQDYSGRGRRQDLTNAVAFLNQSIKNIRPKADDSMKAARAYALSNGLGITDGMPAAEETAGKGSSGSVEANRQLAQTKVLLLQQQISQAKASGSRSVFQAPQLEANADLYKQYQAVEASLSDLRSRLYDNDQLVLNLERQRQSLITTLNRQTIGLLQGELATAQAALDASTRPKEVVLKHRELVSQALRDEKTITELENQLQLAQLEQAKQGQPWELISKPTLLDAPVAPKKSRIMALGLIAGLVIGCGAALVVDRRSGLVFSEEELQQLLPGPLLAHLDPQAMQGKLTLLARGALSGSHRVALVPVGLPPKSIQVQRLMTQLKEQLPHTELSCSRDLVEAASCDHQLLITSLGAANRSELTSLQQQLNLQGRPITGWLLLDDQARAV